MKNQLENLLEAEKLINKLSPKVGDKVSWREHPEVKSTIVAIKSYRNGGNRVRYFKTSNGQWLTKDEVIKL